MKEKSILIITFCSVIFFSFSIGLLSYPWPVSPFNSQHQINGTLAEYRPTHFHAGVDIAAALNTNVYPVLNGEVPNVFRPGDTPSNNDYVNNHFVRVGNFDYVHIVPNQGMINWLYTHPGQNYSAIACSTLIGTIDNENHLHFEEEDGAQNPLRVGALTPFVDTAKPVVEDVDFWKQGTSDELTGALYGKVDLRVDAYDPRTSANGASAGHWCGIYRIKIEFWSGGERIGDRIAHHIYNSIPPCNLSIVYASGSSSTNFLYWATNDPFNTPYNKYWNTKQRKGHDYTVDSPIAKEAMYGEGNLQILVIAEDIRGNADTMRLGQQ